MFLSSSFTGYLATRPKHANFALKWDFFVDENVSIFNENSTF